MQNTSPVVHEMTMASCYKVSKHLFFLLKKNIYLFVCACISLCCCKQELQLHHVGCSSQNRDQTQALYIGNAES